MSLTYAIDIHAPVDKVFDLVADADKMKLWMSGLENVVYPEPLDPENPVGTKFTMQLREGGRLQDYAGEVTAHDRPHHLGVRLGNAAFTVLVDYRFTAIPQGTRLDYACDLTFHNWLLRLLAGLMAWFNRLLLKKQLRKLKEVAEKGS